MSTHCWWTSFPVQFVGRFPGTKPGPPNTPEGCSPETCAASGPGHAAEPFSAEGLTASPIPGRRAVMFSLTASGARPIPHCPRRLHTVSRYSCCSLWLRTGPMWPREFLHPRNCGMPSVNACRKRPAMYETPFLVTPPTPSSSDDVPEPVGVYTQTNRPGQFDGQLDTMVCAEPHGSEVRDEGGRPGPVAGLTAVDAAAVGAPFLQGSWTPPWSLQGGPGAGPREHRESVAAGSGGLGSASSLGMVAGPSESRPKAPRLGPTPRASSSSCSTFLARTPFGAGDLGKRLVWVPEGRYAIVGSGAVERPPGDHWVENAAVPGGTLLLEGYGLYPMAPERGWPAPNAFGYPVCVRCEHLFVVWCTRCGLAACCRHCFGHSADDCAHDWDCDGVA